MRYFPLATDRFEHQFGIGALPPGDSIIEVTDHFDTEIRLKCNLLDQDLDNYFAALRGTERQQHEAVALVTQAMPRTLPPCRDDLVEHSPLLSLARRVQEDLVILSDDASQGHPVIAGVVCFPSGWTIAEKIGQSIMDVHRPVPEYATAMGASTTKLLAHLKPGRPVWRMNWGVRRSGRLDQSPKHLVTSKATLGNVGEQCYFRVERQTLSRLPETGAVLFTIHTHQCQLRDLECWQKANLLGVLQSCPMETLRYKGIADILDPVCDFLSPGDSSQ